MMKRIQRAAEENTKVAVQMVMLPLSLVFVDMSKEVGKKLHVFVSVHVCVSFCSEHSVCQLVSQ